MRVSYLAFVIGLSLMAYAIHGTERFQRFLQIVAVLCEGYFVGVPRKVSI
jgi:hypothetical protein